MSLPTSKQELIDYCLRELGAPVINIEIDQAQLSDRIDYAVKKFIDRHYDGVTEGMYKAVIKKEDYDKGYITLPKEIVSIIEILGPPSSSSIEPLDSVEYHLAWDLFQGGIIISLSDYYISMSHLSLVKQLLGKTKTYVYNTITKKLSLQYNKSIAASGNYLKSASDFTKPEWNPINSTLTQNDVELANGKLLGATCTANVIGEFGFKQTIETKSYPIGTYTFEILLKGGSYTGDVTITVEDGGGNVAGTKTVTLNANRWTSHYVTATFSPNSINDVSVVVKGVSSAIGEVFHMHNPTLYANAFVVAHCYKAIDGNVDINLWSDEWLMKYSTALAMKQWGANIRKYSGVQLPGGVELNGQVIFDEAVAELEKLDEQFSMEYELPVDFYFE